MHMASRSMHMAWHNMALQYAYSLWLRGAGEGLVFFFLDVM